MNEKLQRDGHGCLELSMDLKLHPFMDADGSSSEDQDTVMRAEDEVVEDKFDDSDSDDDDYVAGREWKYRLFNSISDNDKIKNLISKK